MSCIRGDLPKLALGAGYKTFNNTFYRDVPNANVLPVMQNTCACEMHYRHHVAEILNSLCTFMSHTGTLLHPHWIGSN